MYGEKALELIKDLQRNPGLVPPYNEENLRNALEEMNALYAQNMTDVSVYSSSTQESDRNLYATVQWRHSSIERNKRLILAYLHNRLTRIQALRWEFGSVLPADIRHNFSNNEVIWFQKYNKNLTNYMRSIGDNIGLDLTQNMKPPKSLYVEVRCLQDYGEFETEEGILLILKKNTQHFLLRSDAEKLIRQGVLEHILA
uniref:DNA replication complex GINS protein PSF1 n=1 Tax=Romanomermis culicivorax TaxID=13658 RepID=A0A915L2R8_ROMCU